MSLKYEVSFKWHYMSKCKEIKRHGKVHSLDGPSEVWSIHGVVSWHRYGKLHREDGPAITYPFGCKYEETKYYLYGHEYVAIIYWIIYTLMKLKHVFKI